MTAEAGSKDKPEARWQSVVQVKVFAKLRGQCKVRQKRI